MTDKSVAALKISGPIVATVRVSSLSTFTLRLDAKYYREAFTLAKTRVAGCGLPTVEVRKLAEAFVPGRMALVTSPNKNAGRPYLRAHDAFDTLPQSRRHIVESRTRNYDSYLLKEGMILTPSSGRNLGPLAYVGKYLTQFAMTDIMRVMPLSKDEGFFLLGYLMTPTGQALIRRGRTGTTVDHLGPDDVLSIPVVWPNQEERTGFSERIRQAQRLLDEAREAICAAEKQFHDYAGLQFENLKPKYYASEGARIFTRRAGELTLRLGRDSPPAPHPPLMGKGLRQF